MTESDFRKKGIIEIKYIDVNVKEFDEFNCELLKILDKYHINALVARKEERMYRYVTKHN